MAYLGLSMRRLTHHLASLPFSPQQRQSSILQSTDSSVIRPSADFTSNERQSSQSKTLDDKKDIILTTFAALTFIYMMITTNGQSVKNEVMPLLVSMNQRIEKMDVKMDENKKELEVRLNETKRELEGKIDSKIDRLEGKMDENKKELEAQLNETKRELEGKMEKLEGKMEKLEGKMDDNFKSLNEKLDRLAEKKRWLW